MAQPHAGPIGNTSGGSTDEAVQTLTGTISDLLAIATDGAKNIVSLMRELLSASEPRRIIGAPASFRNTAADIAVATA